MAEDPLYHPSSDEKLLQGILYFVYYRMSEVFDIIWAMTRGGPNDISSTPSIMLYTQGFSYKLFGRSSAYGVILLVLGVVLSLITNHLFREDKDLAM